MRRIEPTDLVGTSPVWLLDLHFGGQVYRVASEPVNVQAADGTMHSYVGGLSPVSLVEDLGRSKFSAPELSATVQAVLPVSVAEIRGRGHDWLSARAALYLTAIRDTDRRLTVPDSILSHADAWMQIEGQVRSPSYAEPGRPAGFVEFSIEATAWMTPDPVLDGDRRLTTSKWPNLDAESAGKREPLIIGSPGVYRDTDGTETYAPGSPAYVVDRDPVSGNADKLLVAGHPSTSQGGVKIYDADGNGYGATAMWEADGDGDIVTTVDITGGFSIISLTDTQYFCAWSAAIGGASADLAAGALEDAVDVAAYFLGLSGLKIDAPAWQALRGRVSTIKVAGYINDDVSAWEYVSRHVLPLLPVSIRFTRQGWAPVLYDPIRRGAEAVAHVRARDTPDHSGSGDWTPISGLALDTEPEDVPQQIAVSLANDVRTSTPVRTILWQGTGAGPVERYKGPVSLRNRAGSLYLDHAATRGGVSRQELTLSAIWDVPSASAVVRQRARMATMPTESASYAAPWHWGWLQVGDPVLVDDAGKGFTSQPAQISTKALVDGSWEFEVLFDEDPIRDSRAIS